MKQDTESLPFVFNFTVSIASVVFAIAGEKKKKILCFQLIFLYCVQRP